MAEGRKKMKQLTYPKGYILLFMIVFVLVFVLEVRFT
jgi:hypothetical protein